MAKATKVTRSTKAAKEKKAIRAPVKNPGSAAGKAPAQRRTGLDRASLEGMFKAAISRNEAFEVAESDDYDIAVEHFNQVIQLLDAILAVDPGYRDVINYKGMMLYGCGHIAQAIECFDSILRLNPADKEALNNKGIALYGLGRDGDALKCVEAAIAIDARYADAYLNKAVILHSLGRTEEADGFIRKARAFEAIIG